MMESSSNQPSANLVSEEKCMPANARQEIKKPAEIPRREAPVSLVAEEKRTQASAKSEIKKPSEAPRRKPTAGNLVMGAIRYLKNARGSSFSDIKKYLNNKYQSSDIVDVKKLKLFIKNAVDEGILEKDGVRYRIKEATKASANKNSTDKRPVPTRQRETGSSENKSSEPKAKKGLEKKKSNGPEKSKKSKIAKAAGKAEAKNRAKKSQAERVEEE